MITARGVPQIQKVAAEKYTVLSSDPVAIDAIDWHADSVTTVRKPDDDEVHVWRINLNQNRMERLERMLSADERERAERFVFARDKRRFVVGRAVLRMMLANYLELKPECIRFSYGTEGKPFLAQGIERNLSFNLTNCEDLALAAFSIDREVGIDLERLDREIEVEEIAAQFFTPGEVAAIRALRPEFRHLRFFEFWTRKEAYIKALGYGLSVPLNEFDVASILGRPGFCANGSSVRWSMRQFAPEPGYVGALMVSADTVRIRWFDADLLSTWAEIDTSTIDARGAQRLVSRPR
jgi:4'-phosphopantetheinyl transferase